MIPLIFAGLAGFWVMKRATETANTTSAPGSVVAIAAPAPVPFQVEPDFVDTGAEFTIKTPLPVVASTLSALPGGTGGAGSGGSSGGGGGTGGGAHELR